MKKVELTEKIYQVLDELNITYVCHNHPPVYTVAEASLYNIRIDGVSILLGSITE